MVFEKWIPDEELPQELYEPPPQTPSEPDDPTKPIRSAQHAIDSGRIGELLQALIDPKRADIRRDLNPPSGGQCTWCYSDMITLFGSGVGEMRRLCRRCNMSWNRKGNPVCAECHETLTFGTQAHDVTNGETISVWDCPNGHTSNVSDKVVLRGILENNANLRKAIMS
jgi:hypothetical protein